MQIISFTKIIKTSDFNKLQVLPNKHLSGWKLLFAISVGFHFLYIMHYSFKKSITLVADQWFCTFL